MRSEALAVALLLGCSSPPSGPMTDASDDFSYYSGDGNVYAMNDAAPACQPASMAGFTPTSVTPLVNPVCTNAQITGLVTQCFDPSLPDNTACAAWKADPANEACITTCPTATDVSAMSWGPLVRISNPGVIEFFDLGACVALFDPSPAGQACATALFGELQCEHAACSSSCPIPAADAGVDASTLQSTEIAYQDCTFAADSTVCASYVDAAAQCASTIAPGALFCVNGSLESGDPSSFDPAAEKLLGAQCGGAPDDGGSVFGSDASPPDAGTD